MGESDLVRKIRIVKTVEFEGDGRIPTTDLSWHMYDPREDITHAAYKLGYQPGDVFKYKIIIKAKK